MLQPHPYFKLSPLKGIIPANGEASISITFNPVTLGTSSCTVRLVVAQHGFVPIDCVISAKALSGMIQSRELAIANDNVNNFIANTEFNTTQSLGTVNFPKNLEATMKTFTGSRDKASRTDLAASKAVSMMLNSTFQTDKLDATLRSVVRDPKLDEKIGKADRKAGLLRVRGPGSGAAFDPGAQWLTSAINGKRAMMTSKGLPLTGASTILPPPDEDKIIEVCSDHFSLLLLSLISNSVVFNNLSSRDYAYHQIWTTCRA